MSNNFLRTVAARFKEYLKYGPREHYGEIEEALAEELYWKSLLLKVNAMVALFVTGFLALFPVQTGISLFPLDTPGANRAHGYLAGATAVILLSIGRTVIKRLPEYSRPDDEVSPDSSFDEN